MEGQNGKNLSLMIMLSHNHARKNSSIYLSANFDFFNLKIDFVDFLVKVLTLLTFFNKCKSVKNIMGQN